MGEIFWRKPKRYVSTASISLEFPFKSSYERIDMVIKKINPYFRIINAGFNSNYKQLT